MRPWYCAQAHVGQEELARTELTRQGITCFLPSYLTKTKNRHINVRCLFRGYVFVTLDDPASWPIVHRSHGIQRMLTHWPEGADYMQALPIDGEAIESLRLQALTMDEIRRGGRRPSLPIQTISAGVYVRVTAGIFKDEDYAQKALVDWAEGNRATLLLKMFRREVKVEFYQKDLELVAA